MLTLHPRVFLQRRFGWLLWLALLMPVAQLGAAWHAISHSRPDTTGEADGKPALPHAHCDLCLVAAALGSAAPAGEPPLVAHLAVRHAMPRVDAGSVWTAPSARAYESRAPPFAQP
jgi:hypothetical protein